MKRFLTALLLGCFLVIGGMNVEAKTSKKSSSGRSSSSVTVRMDEDGDPIIVGHTYRFTANGVKMDLVIGDDGVDFVLSSGGYKETYGTDYEYDGETFSLYPVYSDGYVQYGRVSRDGKTIRFADGTIFKVIR